MCLERRLVANATSNSAGLPARNECEGRKLGGFDFACALNLSFRDYFLIWKDTVGS